VASDDGTTSVKEQVAQILADVEATFSRPDDVNPAITRASAALQALVPITEVDRVHVLVGIGRLLHIGTELSGNDEDLVRQRDQIAETLQRRYSSPDTPYLRSRTIVEEVAEGLAAGKVPGDVVSAAFEEIGNLPFEEVDRPAQMMAVLAVTSLIAAHAYLATPQPNQESDPKGIIQLSLKTSDLALRLGGFDREMLVDGARRFRESRASLDGTPHGHAQLLQIMLGIGLRANASALPALEPICDLIMAALTEAGPQQYAGLTFVQRCEAILDRFEKAMAAEGYSEYLWRQGVADLQELKPNTTEETEVLFASLSRLADAARPYIPPEMAQSLEITRDALVAMGRQVGDGAEGPLSSTEIRARAETLLQGLRDELAAGGVVEPALTRALLGIQLLGSRLKNDDIEESLRGLFKVWPQMLEVVTPYLGPDKQQFMADATRTLKGIFSEALIDAKGAERELVARSVYRDLSDWACIVDGREADSARADDPFYQFRVLLQPINYRLMAIQDVAESRRYDHAEASRVKEKLQTALERFRAATTEEQWVLQQRTAIRPALLALRRFERRHHLTTIDPPWPAQLATVDPNAAFISGLREVRPAVDAALAKLGMAEPVAHGVDDPMHTRWKLLRRSAVAVFDFTGFDRATSDPSGALPRTNAALDAVAHAAAPTAQVAYEYGWALVLGIPTMAVARAGQTTPFDVDVEPVRLHGDSERDGMAIALGLQAALIGTQREARASVDLSATINYLHQRFSADPSASDLLTRMHGSEDATAVQYAAESLLERSGGRGGMLAWPAYKPVYPPVTGRRALFHVTAFRPWSRPCENALRKLCGEEIEYRIGYEHLDPDIMGAIWRDLASASYVVADLTLLNPNAALELGIAHALGRPTLVISRTPGLGKHMPALAKVRTHTYGVGKAGLKDLEDLVRRFVSETSGRL